MVASRRAAMEAVREAARFCRLVEAQLAPSAAPEKAVKADLSPVTVADLGAQALIVRSLRRAFPSVPIVGEEDTGVLTALDRGGGNALRDRLFHDLKHRFPPFVDDEILECIARGGHGGGAGRFYALDPVDGTKGFLRREQYAIALALVDGGQLLVGVLGCPHYAPAPGDGQAAPGDGPAAPHGAPSSASPDGTLFVAMRGGGAFECALPAEAEQHGSPAGAVRERAIRVSVTDDVRRAVFCESVEAAHSAQGDAARVAAVLGVTSPPLRMDSQVKYAAVARGDADLYLRLPTHRDYEEKIWDHAAGALLVAEAGGEVTDVDGRALDFTRGRTLRDNRGVVASNGRLHAVALDAVRRVLSSKGA